MTTHFLFFAIPVAISIIAYLVMPSSDERDPRIKESALRYYKDTLAGMQWDRGPRAAPLDEITHYNLDSETEMLVRRFSSILARKLARAKETHGLSNQWMDDDWETQCRASLLAHIEKGDPVDVAIYCAFMSHHGWKTK